VREAVDMDNGIRFRGGAFALKVPQRYVYE
jgi:hypothetical protein